MAKYLIGVLVGALAIVLVGVVIAPKYQQPVRQGGTQETNFITSPPTYTETSVSSTRQRICAENSGRRELAISDFSTSNTSTLSLFFTTASTTAKATSGYAIAPIIVSGEPFVPPFVWTGEVWAIRNQGTAAFVACAEGN